MIIDENGGKLKRGKLELVHEPSNKILLIGLETFKGLYEALL